MADHLRHINRPLTEKERRLAADIQDGARKDFPPKAVPRKPSPLAFLNAFTMHANDAA
ncbi:MAG: hypothetical protein ACC628_08170 [Pirellulaceae bacterium]